MLRFIHSSCQDIVPISDIFYYLFSTTPSEPSLSLSPSLFEKIYCFHFQTKIKRTFENDEDMRDVIFYSEAQ